MEPAPAELLGAEEGGVGVAQQRRVIGTRATMRDPDGDRGRQLRPVRQRHRLGHRNEEPPGEVFELVARTVLHDHELVAPQPRDQVARSDAATHPPGHFDEHLVAGVVPESVVDDFEVVEVTHAHTHSSGTGR